MSERIVHCEHCGRVMVPHIEDEGFNRDGTPRTSEWLVCPRFNRSWRNLWCGGWMHQGVQADEDGMLEMRWM